MGKSKKVICIIAIVLVILIMIVGLGWVILRLCGYSIRVDENTWREQPAKTLHITKKGTSYVFTYVNGILKEEAKADANTMTAYFIAYDGQEIAPTMREGSEVGGKAFMTTYMHAPVPKLPFVRTKPYE